MKAVEEPKETGSLAKSVCAWKVFLFSVELPELYGLKGEPPNSCVESLTSRLKE